MQEARDLILNLALLIAIAVVYQIATSRFSLPSMASRLIVGVAFGLIAVVGMIFPLTIIAGLIFDGRSVILSLAALFGGPVVAGVAAAIAGAYRYWIGGPGMLVGIMSIAVSTAIGLAFHAYRQRLTRPLRGLELYALGLLVQIAMLGLFMLLPNGESIVRRLGPVLMLTYPLATLFLGLLFQDYENQARVREHLHHLAYYDVLTGLPNRAMLIERLQQVLLGPATAGQAYLLAILNLDRFKIVNDARGHDFGRGLLKAIALRLRALLPRDFVARIGSDEFAAIVDCSHADARGTAKLLEDLVQSLRAPIRVGEEELSIGASLGATLLAAEHVDRASDALRRADTALHKAKLCGGSRSVFYDAAMSAEAEHRYAIERDLRQAIGTGQLRLYLQSQVDAAGRLIGAEALVRWQHPTQGLLTPAAFIPIAEDSDLIIAIDAWVFGEVCRLLGQPPLSDSTVRLGVNVSTRHFQQPDFLSWVEGVLRHSSADPRRIVLEVTESLLLNDPADAAEKMNRLARLGLRFSIDDFGTGYSSLAYLKRLPIDEIKIDRSFVQDMLHNAEDAAIVGIIFAIAERLSLQVVAEGVETQAQADFLNAHGPVIHQGYLYARPEPSKEWLRHLA